jgi:hypothetical protein
LRTDPVRVLAYVDRIETNSRASLEASMQLPDFNQQLAGDRQARYRADAAMSRLTRPDRSGDGRASSSVSARRPADPMSESSAVLGRETRRPSSEAERYGYTFRKPSCQALASSIMLDDTPRGARR